MQKLLTLVALGELATSLALLVVPSLVAQLPLWVRIEAAQAHDIMRK
jgi:hypothetical protein